MNRVEWQWMVGGIAVLGLAALGFVFGMNLLPSRDVAETRGTLAPWILTWGLIWMTALAATMLAAFLIAASLGKTGRSD